MNSILVSSVRSNKSENNVWAVYVQGQEEKKSYCKSPYKAMRYAFFLKKLTGCRIADNSLALLSLEIKRIKEASMTAEQKAAKAASEREQSDACISTAEREQARTKCKEHVEQVVEQFVEEHSVDNVLAKDYEAKAKAKKASRKRKPSTKKAKKEVAD